MDGRESKGEGFRGRRGEIKCVKGVTEGNRRRESRKERKQERKNERKVF